MTVFPEFPCPQKHRPVDQNRQGSKASMAQQDPSWIHLQSLLESSVFSTFCWEPAQPTSSLSAAEFQANPWRLQFLLNRDKTSTASPSALQHCTELFNINTAFTLHITVLQQYLKSSQYSKGTYNSSFETGTPWYYNNHTLKSILHCFPGENSLSWNKQYFIHCCQFSIGSPAPFFS